MFEIALEAGVAAAVTWTPECAEPGGGGGCCPLCFGRYRIAVLDGPLRGLPHAVAHAVVVAVDERIRLRVDASPALAHGDAERTRRAEATGSLLVVALTELGAARRLLSELRRRCVEPAMEHYLAALPFGEVPGDWH